jgi:uncharacterized protein YndB with AHSA1/START domain
MTELKIERKLAADAKTVFEYVMQTRHLLKWWGPEGMTVPEHDLDLSKPGPWSSVMMNADGQRYKVTGEVIAVDPPHSVEFTWGWHDENDVRGHDTRVRFEIHPARSGTRFVLVHTGLADEESAKNHEMGWSSSLNKLERLAS